MKPVNKYCEKCESKTPHMPGGDPLKMFCMNCVSHPTIRKTLQEERMEIMRKYITTESKEDGVSSRFDYQNAMQEYAEFYASTILSIGKSTRSTHNYGDACGRCGQPVVPTKIGLRCPHCEAITFALLSTDLTKTNSESLNVKEGDEVKEEQEKFLLHLIDVTACFVMEQNMFLATDTRKELIDKARQTYGAGRDKGI